MIGISIVEDNLQYRLALVKLLESSGEFLLKGVYSSAEEAFPKLLVHQPDIAIIDIGLPMMSGIALIEKIRYTMPRLQFLLVTLPPDDQIFKASNAGVSGSQRTIFDEEQIKDAIKELFICGASASICTIRKSTRVSLQKQFLINSFGLRERELEVLKLMSKGLLYKEIGENLSISGNTVKNHLKRIYKKMRVQNKIEAMNKYQSHFISNGKTEKSTI